MKSRLSTGNLGLLISGLAIAAGAIMLLALLLSPRVTAERGNQAILGSIQSEPTPPAPLREANFGSWRYSAGQAAGQNHISAVVTYDESSIQAIRAYAEANKALANQLTAMQGQIEVYITFRTYVEPGQFQVFAKRTAYTPVRTTLRMTESDGRRGTAWLSPAGTDLLPTSQLNTLPANTVSKGVISSYGWVNGKDLPTLLNDPAVFIVDVTPDIVRSDLASHNIAGAAETQVQLSPESPFWKMEDFGLENFSK